MFGKQSGSSTTIIGRGARFVGTLELQGAVHVEGHCEGTLRAHGQLSVGPHGSVVGELAGQTVMVAGQVEGTVVAQETLHVLKTGGVKGDAYYGRLRVDGGGVIDGRTRQGPPPVDDGGVEQTGVIDARPKPPSVRPLNAESGKSSAARPW